MAAVAMVGNLSEGYRVVGPFDTFDDAVAWCDKHGFSESTWVATLDAPEREKCAACIAHVHDACGLVAGCPCCEDTISNLKGG